MHERKSEWLDFSVLSTTEGVGTKGRTDFTDGCMDSERKR